ncbi:hypothetical protein [Pontibacter sp. H249]|uniref:hypothetical protein n=1 Tax=Pontibacter sp. H249 TaxID=3133420 RepID=UPI0030BF5AC9
MNNNEIDFYIPTNLNIREILKKEGKGKRYIDCQIDKYHWFISSIYLRSITDKRYESGDFLPMNYQVMEDNLGIRYIDDIKRILSENGIIENDGDFTVGVKSIGYRLTPQYQVKHDRILYDSDSTFIKKLRLAIPLKIAAMDDITRYTYHQLNEIGIHREAAEQYVDDWYQQNSLVKNPTLLKKLNKSNKKRREKEKIATAKGQQVKSIQLTYQQMLEKKRDSYLYQIRAIDEKLWLPNRDNKGRRVHTYLSNLWSELRQFLFIKSKPNTQLVSLDCSNSQPYTLAKIILEYFDGIIDSTTPTDVVRYIDLVTTGKLYSFMCQELSITDLDEIADFKVNMFSRVFYCENHKSFFSKEAKVFLKFFPTVYQIVMQEKKYQYNQLSIKMQRVESEAILDIALTNLKVKYGMAVWFGSIHDSILCEKGFEDEVRQVMIDAYTQVLGIAPHIKVAENINVVKDIDVAVQANLPDTTPLAELQQRFEAQFKSTPYKELIAHKEPEIDYRIRKRREAIERGIEW